MNKQIADKIRFFMTGMAGRLAPDAKEIDSVKASFTSGLKNYTFSAVPEYPAEGETAIAPEASFCFNFSGGTYTLTYPELIGFVCERVPDYDSLDLIFESEERDTLIEARERNVVLKNTSKAAPGPAAGILHDPEERASMSDRKYFLKPETAGTMLRAIGVMGENGKLRNDKIRKYNQIDHFIELIDPILKKLAAEKQGKNARPISIVDCACGKSYLSFALYHYIRYQLGTPCRFTGLDYNPVVIKDSQRIAGKLGCSEDMEFIETDISKYTPSRKYDLLITLHACDTATDMALRFGIDNGIKAIVCVPCCHREMNEAGYTLEGLEPITGFGILKARIADNLTDGLRGLYLEAQGYEVSMVEYISPLDTPKNLMMRCYRNHGFSSAYMEKFHSICSELGVTLSIEKLGMPGLPAGVKLKTR